jgi:hypothetical protein
MLPVLAFFFAPGDYCPGGIGLHPTLMSVPSARQAIAIGLSGNTPPNIDGSARCPPNPSADSAPRISLATIFRLPPRQAKCLRAGA